MPPRRAKTTPPFDEQNWGLILSLGLLLIAITVWTFRLAILLDKCEARCEATSGVTVQIVTDAAEWHEDDLEFRRAESVQEQLELETDGDFYIRACNSTDVTIRIAKRLQLCSRYDWATSVVRLWDGFNITISSNCIEYINQAAEPFTTNGIANDLCAKKAEPTPAVDK